MHDVKIVSLPQRLDQFVAEAFHMSRAQAVKRIREGAVRCNGEVNRRAAKRLQPGDVVRMVARTSVHATRAPARTEVRATLPLLYGDTSCLVINKPQGLVVQPTGTADTAEPTLLEILLRNAKGAPRLLVHRLDRGTTGCLLVAKSPEACEALQRQFRERSVTKEYLAIVAGIPQEQEAMIDAAIGRSLVDRTRMTLFRTAKSRNALTSYRTLSTGKECSLLRCAIHTGRTHQIRVHLAAIGHPILGDAKYGDARSRALAKEHGMTSPCLHAWKLAFTSPATEQRVEAMAEVPGEFRETAEKFGMIIPPSPPCPPSPHQVL